MRTGFGPTSPGQMGHGGGWPGQEGTPEASRSSGRELKSATDIARQIGLSMQPEIFQRGGIPNLTPPPPPSDAALMAGRWLRASFTRNLAPHLRFHPVHTMPWRADPGRPGPLRGSGLRRPAAAVAAWWTHDPQPAPTAGANVSAGPHAGPEGGAARAPARVESRRRRARRARAALLRPDLGAPCAVSPPRRTVLTPPAHARRPHAASGALPRRFWRAPNRDGACPTPRLRRRSRSTRRAAGSQGKPPATRSAHSAPPTPTRHSTAAPARASRTSHKCPPPPPPPPIRTPLALRRAPRRGVVRTLRLARVRLVRV